MVSNVASLTVLSLLAANVASAAVVTYTADANTLHLWHMDETAAPVADSGTSPLNLGVLANGATLGNGSYTGFGFGLSTLDSGLNGAPASLDAYLAATTLVAGTGDNTTMTYAGANGAFTFEAIIRLDVDLTQTFVGSTRGTAPMQIFSGEQDVNSGRTWQFRIDPVGFNPNADGVTTALTTPALEFINVNNAVAPVQNRIVLLPTVGANAVAPGAYYHVAVSYNGAEGTAGNLSIYWTRVEDSRIQADLLVSRQLDTDLPAGPPDFAIGNTGRTTPNNNFLGLIDEVRISGVARGANDFIFRPVPEPSAGLFALAGAALLRRRRRS